MGGMLFDDDVRLFLGGNDDAGGMLFEGNVGPPFDCDDGDGVGDASM
jgi:hypothetical protein